MHGRPCDEMNVNRPAPLRGTNAERNRRATSVTVPRKIESRSSAANGRLKRLSTRKMAGCESYGSPPSLYDAYITLYN